MIIKPEVVDRTAERTAELAGDSILRITYRMLADMAVSKAWVDVPPTKFFLAYQKALSAKGLVVIDPPQSDDVEYFYVARFGALDKYAVDLVK